MSLVEGPRRAGALAASGLVVLGGIVWLVWWSSGPPPPGGRKVDVVDWWWLALFAGPFLGVAVTTGLFRSTSRFTRWWSALLSFAVAGMAAIGTMFVSFTALLYATWPMLEEGCWSPAVRSRLLRPAPAGATVVADRAQPPSAELVLVGMGDDEVADAYRERGWPLDGTEGLGWYAIEGYWELHIEPRHGDRVAVTLSQVVDYSRCR